MSITRGAIIAARGPGQRGVTLIELVIFIVVVSIAVVGLLQIFARTTASSADPQLRKQALAIAEAMLDEIEGARFTYCPADDPAAETATSVADCTLAEGPANSIRPYYRVSDYNLINPPYTYTTTDAAGNDFPKGYVADVVISPVLVNDKGLQHAPSATDPTALRITVTVSYGANQQIVLDGYRTRYAPNSIP
ncbi:type IV pilus modification PilV family protein [Janthinobacterium sp. HLS12-2]|uniref:type IV pilus modification PilV family protein n=1 Tax=Janthinobacterium sp. HLS12-2 TaxID=1259324 RepID=UPI003F2148F7